MNLFFFPCNFSFFLTLNQNRKSEIQTLDKLPRFVRVDLRKTAKTCRELFINHLVFANIYLLLE